MTTYKYRVTAYNQAGDSVSNEVTRTLAATSPGPPLAVVAVAGNASAAVSWSAPSTDGQSPPITAYNVTTSPAGGSCPATATLGCTVTGLTNGTSYTFKVTATNGVGPGPASAPSNAVIPGTAPAAPARVTAVPEPGAAGVVWTAPVNPAIVITGYTVTSSPPGGSCTTTGAIGCKVTGLTNGVLYSFTVTATNTFGTSAASTSNSVTPVTVPDPPTGASATGGNGQALVTWLAPANTGSLPILHYTVTSSPGGFTCTTNGALGCTVTGLTNGSSYAFTVVAANSYGPGAPSTPASAIIPATVPGAPPSVVAVAGAGSASVAWAVPASNGKPITGYTVTSSPGNLTCTTTGATTCVVHGLATGLAYTFTVTATNSIGTGAPSEPSASVTLYAGTTYFALAPARILDTRINNGLSGPFSSHVARTFQVTGGRGSTERHRGDRQPDRDPADQRRLPVRRSGRR